MNYNIALEIMCARCIDYEACGGTGCVPKQGLEELIELAKDIVKSMEVNDEKETKSSRNT